ncbi:unnamed protein product [Staurois parvus]|uniref:Uncharacterized protein n=1 Tax=Staurois parvus TaxID=386267 RepID=A0ABN9DLU4_9NEOB|nr:unnamed protein product [Staurois parvus]CAI9573504.1 unnamed protein product [Staurois parvus]
MPPASAHQCLINATYQCLPVHINATYQCPSELPFSVTYQCQSVPPISAANQCHLLVPCPSVLPISAHQCSLSVPITAASLAHISEGEKSLTYKML